MAGRFALSAWIYLLIAGLALLDVISHWPWMAPVSAGLTILYLVLEVNRAQGASKAVGLSLIALGLLAAAVSGQFAETALDGFARAKTFLLLFFAVAWLQIPARESPSLIAAREVITRQPPGRRYLVSALGVHGLGAVLNLAGLSLVSAMIERKSEPVLQRRLTTALMLGFTSASSWSPFYVSMVVVLIALPTLEWTDVAPLGFVLAMGCVMCGYLFDRWAWPRREESAPGPPPRLAASERVRVFAVLSSLSVLVIGMVEFAGVSIPVALGLIAPPHALLWRSSLASHPEARPGRMRELATNVIDALPSLRSEVLVFTGATVFGVGVSSLAPEGNLSALLNHWVPNPDFRIVLLTIGVPALGMIGLHPVVAVILIGEVLPPEVLGLPDWIVGLALLGVWGMSTIISPYSATTLFLARTSNVSAYRVAWRWNLPSGILAVTFVTLLVIALRRLSL